MSTPLRVLHLRASPFVGGPERQILRYVSFDFGPDVEQVIGSFVDESEGKSFLRAAKSAGLRTVAFSPGSRTALRELRSFVREQKISLICTHGYKADVLGVVAGKLGKVPVACFLRGFTAQDFKVRLYERLDRTMLRFATAVVALSGSQLKKLKVTGEKTHVVTNVIEDPQLSRESVASARENLRKRFGLPPDCKVVASAGRLSPEKGTAHFIQAAKILAARFPHTRFVVFGEGPERPALESMLHGANSIILAGHTPDFRELLPGVDILVNPSLMEEMPNVVLEAMSCGLPVVATSVGGVPDIAGPTGPEQAISLIAPGDPNAIVDAVAQLLESPTDAARLASVAQRRIASEYSPERQRHELAALYKKLLPGFHDAAKKAGIAPVLPLPFITVAMPVRNEERYIKGVLDALLAQDYPKDRYEIIVAEGESTDRTRAIVDEAAKVSPVPIKLFNNPKRLSSAGRNVGINNGQGEVIAFVDGHCVIQTDRWLRDIADIFRTTNAACLCRPQPLDDPANTPFQYMIATCRGSALGHGLDSSIFDLNNEKFIDPTSSGAIYKREVFEQIGAYDESFDACEDVELNYRVWKRGLPAYISPRLTIRYAPRENLKGLFKQMSRYGQGRFRFIRKHPDAISLGQLIPPCFVAVFLICLILMPFFAPARYAWLILAGLYAVAVILSSVALASKNGIRFLWSAPAIFTTIHFGLGLGFWRGVFKK